MEEQEKDDEMNQGKSNICYKNRRQFSYCSLHIADDFDKELLELYDKPSTKSSSKRVVEYDISSDEEDYEEEDIIDTEQCKFSTFPMSNLNLVLILF